MNACDLTDILLSTEFGQDLQEMSCYLASIKQERPIVYLLAKCLWRRGYKFELEDRQNDLTLDGPPGTQRKRIEFKFHYNRCEEELAHELAEFKAMSMPAAARVAGAHQWGVADAIRRDIIDKTPDLFVWIICSRDLADVPADDLKRICFARQQCRYNATRPYNPDGASLTVVDAFLKTLQQVRPFALFKQDIKTNGLFPSTYHFRICEFSDSDTAATTQE